MTIQSKSRDYYDAISHRFGSDPHVFYERKPIEENVFYSVAARAFPMLEATGADRENRRLKLPDYRIRYLVAGEYVFPLLTRGAYVRRLPHPRGTVLEPEREATLDEFRREVFDRQHPVHREKFAFLFEPNCGVPIGGRHGAVMAVGSPVFVIYRTEDDRYGSRPYFQVESKVPILADLGIPALVPPDQMWQSIYSVLSNVLRTDPDKAPPVALSNDSRIGKAGFDLKLSFRGKSVA